MLHVLVSAVLLLLIVLFAFWAMAAKRNMFRSPWLNMLYLFACFILIAWDPLCGILALAFLSVLVVNNNTVVYKSAMKIHSVEMPTNNTTTSEESHPHPEQTWNAVDRNVDPGEDEEENSDANATQWKKLAVTSNIQSSNGWGSYAVVYDIYEHV